MSDAKPDRVRDFLKKCLRQEAKHGAWSTRDMTGSERAMGTRLLHEEMLEVEQAKGVTSYRLSVKGKEALAASPPG